MAQYYVAWWNVENLFDAEDAASRPDWLQRRLRNELKHWTRDVVAKKIAQLTKVIGSMNDGRGPDLLGVCEVESHTVLLYLAAALKLALGRNYQIAHHDCDDGRGIDVAFIYDGDVLEAEETYTRVILKRNATRDLLQVNFRIGLDRRPFIAIGNHWPARSGGQLESEPYRILAAETLSYWVERIQAHRGPNVPILAMGDFNDEPFHRSLVQYARSTKSPLKVSYARGPALLNLMWPLMPDQGTYYWDNTPTMLDQFLAAKGLKVSSSPLTFVPGSVEIIQHPDMVKSGRYGGPRRFSRPSASSYDPEGFSDHFPIGVRIAEQ